MSGEEESSGYCRRCGQYGQGRFVEVINSHSDAIDRCRPCAVLPAPPRPRPPAFRRRGRR